MSSYAAVLWEPTLRLKNMGGGSTHFGKKQMHRRLSTLQVSVIEVYPQNFPQGRVTDLLHEGAGNSFLGGLSAGLLIANGDVFEGKIDT